MEKEKIEKIARDKFPIGTSFFPAHLNFNRTKEFCVNTNNKFEWVDGNLYILMDGGEKHDRGSTVKKSTKYGNCDYQRLVYEKASRKYATIIKRIPLNNYELWKY